jgi:hypothetical protein
LELRSRFGGVDTSSAYPTDDFTFGAIFKLGNLIEQYFYPVALVIIAVGHDMCT